MSELLCLWGVGWDFVGGEGKFAMIMSGWLTMLIQSCCLIY